jgi:hypothetical protein
MDVTNTMDVTSLKSFKGFHVEQILGDDSLNKLVAVLGRYGWCNVSCAKVGFSDDTYVRILFSTVSLI